MNEQEIKQEIIQSYKELKSTHEETYEHAYNYLVSTFFEFDDIVELDDVNFIDQFQIIQSITYTIIKGMLEEQDYENLIVIIREYDIINNQVGSVIYDEEDLTLFQLGNEFFEKELKKLLNEQ